MDWQDPAKAHDDFTLLTARFTALHQDLTGHLNEEESQMPRQFLKKAWTFERYMAWVKKAVLPHEMQAVRKSGIVGSSAMSAIKRISVAVILMANCIAVWDPSMFEKEAYTSGSPPFFVMNAMKQCFEHRWVTPLKTIDANSTKD